MATIRASRVGLMPSRYHERKHKLRCLCRVPSAYGAYPSEDGAEGLHKHRVLLSRVLPQLFCQIGEQRVVVGGTDVLNLAHAC